MICSYCGTDLPSGAMFCGECGRPVAVRVAAVRGRSKSAASSAATTTRWPAAVAEHQPGDVAAAPRPPRKPAPAEAAAHALVEPPRAADAVFAEPPPSARSAAKPVTPDAVVASDSEPATQEPTTTPADGAAPKPTAAQKSAEAKAAAAAQELADSQARALAEAEAQSRAELARATAAEERAAAEAAELAETERLVEAERMAEEAAESDRRAAEAADEEARLADSQRQAEETAAAEAARLAEQEAAAEAERQVAAQREAAERAEAEAQAQREVEAQAEREAEVQAERARVEEAARQAAAARVASSHVMPGFDGPDVVVHDLLEPRPEETCAQCGAALAASDIFCGVCGFVRKSAVAPAARASDTVAYDPFPWGLPRPADIVPPEEAPAPPDGNFDDESDVEKTRIVDRSVRGDRFVLQFSTGESVSVSGTGLIGRNPVAEPGEYFDALVTIVDPGKSVSKTHLEFGQDSGAFWVSDRFSANGTILREPDRPARRGDAGKRYRLVRGTRVDIGEQFFIVS